MFNIEYHNSRGRRFHYLMMDTDTKAEAKVLLAELKESYFLNGKPRLYPDGSGHYDIINPRVVRV